MEVDKMPESGQFIAMWENEGKLWAATYYWRADKLNTYNPEFGAFCEVSDKEVPFLKRVEARFFV